METKKINVHDLKVKLVMEVFMMRSPIFKT